MMPKTKERVCVNCGCEKPKNQPYEISVKEQRYFRNHLPLHIRREYDRIAASGSPAAAFAHALSALNLDSLNGTTIHAPGVSILPRKRKKARAA